MTAPRARARRSLRVGVIKWTDALFVIGSFCFAIASLPGYGSLLGSTAVGVTYFVGSLFFTSAGLLQLSTSCNPEPSVASSTPDRSRWRIIGVLPRSPDWWASVVQSAGTIWFNINTFNALTTGWDAQEQDVHIWKPDFYGSIAFLVASALAIHVVRSRSAPSRDRAWWIAWVNMAGSVFFMASALAAFVLPSTGSLVDAALANTGTLLGALCFLWAAAHDYRGQPRVGRHLPA